LKSFFFSDNSRSSAFLNWIYSTDSMVYQEQLNYLVSNTLLSKSSSKQLINDAIQSFRDVLDIVIKTKEEFETKLLDLSENFGNNSPAYKAVNYRYKQFLNKHILGYLAESGFLPNAGLPTGVVEFENTSIQDLESNRNRFKENPSYPLTRALTEFAPGNSIVMDGKSYKSAGIVLENLWGRSLERNLIIGCKSCGYQGVLKIDADVREECPQCNDNSIGGIQLGDQPNRPTELIEPAGFSVDLFESATRVISEKSRPEYLEPLLLNVEPWQSDQASFIDYRSSGRVQDAQILFYNKGEGEGYSLCLDCGRVETSSAQLEGHRRLRGGRNNDGESLCSAQNIREHVILGSRFKTDFTEIRLKNGGGSFVTSKSLAYSLGVIFTKALAEFLAIEESELNFGVKKYDQYRTIYIYDIAKGGAGYASQFGTHLRKVLETAHQVLNDCPCVSGCTKCLIDRSSQWHIDNIDKNAALNWLKDALDNELPPDLQAHSDNVSSVFGALQEELASISYHSSIKEITLHLNNTLSDWDSDNLMWLQRFKTDNNQINLCIEGEVNFNNVQEKLSIYFLSKTFKLFKGNQENILGYPVHLSLTLHNGESISYVSQEDYDSLHTFWTSSSLEKFYKVSNYTIENKSEFPVPTFDVSNLFEAKISAIESRGIESSEIATVFTESLSHSENFLNRIKNKNFVVSYYDKYNQSEFSLRIILQFIDKTQTLWGISVSKLNILLNSNDFKETRTPRAITHNYVNLSHYESDLNALSEFYDFDVKLIDGERLPHYRFFHFKSEDTSFSLRIDGGIAHGLKPIDYIIHGELGLGNYPFKIQKFVSHDLIYNVGFE
jgi:DEAD/DEAH box helicase domain-containing protein